MGYHQKENDDDLWSCRQVQELLGLWSPDPQERGHHVHDEGSWRQHPERGCRSWCARWLRQVSSLSTLHGECPRHNLGALVISLLQPKIYCYSYLQPWKHSQNTLVPLSP